MAENGGTPARTRALVTGAAQGIGRGIARALAGAGYRVALADRLGDLAEQEARALRDEGFQAMGLPLDVTQANDWQAGIERVGSAWGGLDVLVNCAGISPRGSAATTDEELWQRTLDINLKGAWLGIRAALPMLQRSRGTILNIGSTRATRPMPGLCSYGVSKAGLLGLTQQVAVEYLETGPTCNMIAPGWVDTPNERELQKQHGRPDFPAGLRNLTTPEEIGAAAVYLASPLARTINGVILYLDAGLHIADDAGMVYLPGRSRPPYEQRIEDPA
jgi:NAD(P)-dependent dehydrogenase (short-subunit alcohol dehydrogenase family)